MTEHDHTPSREQVAAYMQRVSDLVDKHGVMIQGVGGDTEFPGFAYTIGLGLIEHPDFLIVGLPYEVAGTLLNDIAARVREGDRFGHGDTIHNLVRGFPVRLVRIDDPSEHMGTGERFYGQGRAVSAFQIVFPDAGGLWPWEPTSGVANMPILGGVPTPFDGQDRTLTLDSE